MTSIMPAKFVGIAAACCVVMALQPAVARPLAGFNGITPSSIAKCPSIVWRLARDSNGQIHGTASYADLSGLSYVEGRSDNAGHFRLTLKRTDIGNGPVGHAFGTATTDGSISATLVGSGCANNKFSMRPVSDMNSFLGVPMSGG